MSPSFGLPSSVDLGTLVTESQNISGWEGPIRIIKSNPLVSSRLPKMKSYESWMLSRCSLYPAELGGMTTSVGSLFQWQQGQWRRDGVCVVPWWLPSLYAQIPLSQRLWHIFCLHEAGKAALVTFDVCSKLLLTMPIATGVAARWIYCCCKWQAWMVWPLLFVLCVSRFKIVVSGRSNEDWCKTCSVQCRLSDKSGL